MRLFVERFAIPVFAAALMYVVTNQTRLSSQGRVALTIGIIVAAGIASYFGEERHAQQNPARPSSRHLLPLSVTVALVAISILVYTLSPNRKGAEPPKQTAEQEGKLSPGTSALNPKPKQFGAHVEVPAQTPSRNLGTPRGAATRFPEAIHPADGILEYIRIAPNAGRRNLAWPVLMYDESGNVYSILRATAQSVLRDNGKTTPSIFQASIPATRYAGLFNADSSTISQLRPYCDGLVLGMVTTTTSPTQQFDGMYTTHLRADVKLVLTADGVLNEFIIEENGVGFSTDTSKSNGEERLAEKLKAELIKSLSK